MYLLFLKVYFLLCLNKPVWPTARHSGFYWDCSMALGEIFKYPLIHYCSKAVVYSNILHSFLNTEN